MDKQIIVYLYNGIVFSKKRNKLSTDTHNNADESQKHCTEWKNPGAFSGILMSLRSSSYKVRSPETLPIVDDPQNKDIKI